MEVNLNRRTHGSFKHTLHEVPGLDHLRFLFYQCHHQCVEIVHQLFRFEISFPNVRVDKTRMIDSELNEALFALPHLFYDFICIDEGATLSVWHQAFGSENSCVLFQFRNLLRCTDYFVEVKISGGYLFKRS